MTSLRIKHGPCGHTTAVEVTGGGKDGPLGVSIRSECERVEKMAAEIAELEHRTAFARIRDNPVYRAADRHLKHVSCPVPAGILLALEVEAGLNVRSLTTIEFTDVDSEGSPKG